MLGHSFTFMNKIVLALATLSLFHTAQAEILEGNVTIQLTLTSIVSWQETKTTAISKQGNSSFKNADFIKRVGARSGSNFSKAAKLMFSYLINVEEEEFKFFIRDKGKEDLDVTSLVELGQQYSGDTIIIKGKTTPGPLKIGSELQTSLGEARIQTGESNVFYGLEGPYQNNIRYLQSKEDTTKSVATIGLTVLGTGGFRTGDSIFERGIAKGTVKLTTTQVLPTPPED